MSKEYFRKLLASIIERAETFNEAVRMVFILKTMAVYEKNQDFKDWYCNTPYLDILKMFESIYQEVERFGGKSNDQN